MIMALQAGDRLLSLTDLSEMLGIPVHTLYRWRYKGDGPVGYRVGRHVQYAAKPSKVAGATLPRLDSNQQPFGLSAVLRTTDR